ncbi:DNA polymerase III subunit beta [Parvularcula sp. IMCC14364]|uniref:DNA polymerase III subunit beta n=1 Tax=Parvularcula sp. IMCC14364 TaxID=3067902 RepID=UPI002742164D|nr:DNA polymerase III subunit beta [Parvularcula sp. IMCC14364]
MKVIIERSTFLKALGHVQSVVERRNTIPILSNVLLQAEGSALALTATDLDIEIAEQVSADVEQPGAITASALTLYEIVRRLPEGAQVRLDTEGSDGRLKLTAGKSDFNLAVLPDQDFPSLTVDNEGVIFSMPSKELKRLIDKTRFAMSQEETRYYLNGVYFHAVTEGGRALRAVATDGHRLARLDSPLPDGAESIPGVIIPRKAVLELRRLLDDAGEQVQVSVSEAKVRFIFDDVTLTSKLIDGTFPDYQRVIPSGNDRTLKVETADFAKAVDRVSTVSADKTRSIKMILESDHLQLIVNNPETGSAQEELAVDYSAEALEIGFNAKYLLDVASQIDGDTATFEFADPSSPTLISDEEDVQALYVLMPLRV